MLVRIWHGKTRRDRGAASPATTSSRRSTTPKTNDFLLEFEPEVVHYTVVASSGL